MEVDSATNTSACRGILKEIEYTVLMTPKEDHLEISGVNARVVLDDVQAGTGETTHVQ